MKVLLPLPIVLSMCLSQVRLLEMVTPRYLLASTVSNVCPCSLYVVGSGTTKQSPVESGEVKRLATLKKYKKEQQD
jgi:hypothetical protein